MPLSPLCIVFGFRNTIPRRYSRGTRDFGSLRHLLCLGYACLARSVHEMREKSTPLIMARMCNRLRRKQVCGLTSLVREVVTSLRPEIKDREVEWRIEELPFVECDPALMKQVLFNLLSNAVKFTKGRQFAIIEVGQTTLGGEPVVFIRDNGVGFSMKYVDKLFGLFQRLHRQEDYEGTGVGLTIVQRIMHRHGGRVWATAEIDKGATFYLSLQTREVADDGFCIVRQMT